MGQEAEAQSQDSVFTEAPIMCTRLKVRRGGNFLQVVGLRSAESPSGGGTGAVETRRAKEKPATKETKRVENCIVSACWMCGCDGATKSVGARLNSGDD